MYNRVKSELVRVVTTAMVLFAISAMAEDLYVLAPVSVSTSTSYSGWGEPIAMINGSGMTGEGRSGTHTNANERYLFWHSNGTTVSDQWAEFDLGREYYVAYALIWQLAQDNVSLLDRGVKDFTIRLAGEDHVFTDFSSETMTMAVLGEANVPAQIFAVGELGVRYVRFEIDSNYGDQYVGLSEVRFEVSAPPPIDGVFTLAPQVATASTFYSDGTGYGPQFMVDGSGMTGNNRSATHTHLNATKLFWHSDGTTVSNQWVEFDLGNIYTITNALIWQLAQSNLTARGVQDFDIDVAGTNHVFTSYSTGKTLNRATVDPDQFCQIIPLYTQDVRYIRFDINSNFGDTYVGLSEVRFEVILPEPRDLVWDGSPGNAEWNMTSMNWKTNGVATSFGLLDNVTFDETAAVNTATLTAEITAGDILVDSSGTVSINAGTVYGKRIREAASFVKRGTGTLEMAGGLQNVAGCFHSFTCDVQVLEGTLKLVTDSRNALNPVEGLLGNPSVDRTILVTNGATLCFGANNGLGTTLSSPKVKLEFVDGGVLTNQPYRVNTLGPVLFKDAVIAPLTGYYSDWGSLVFNGDVEFKGSNPYTINSLAGAFLAFGVTGMPSIMVDDITGDDSPDLTFNIAVHNAHNMPSTFRKTGAGTLRLNTNLSTFTGDVTVAEGTLETAAGNGFTNEYHSVLGNAKVFRTILVEGGAKVKFAGSNTLVPGYETALAEIVVNGGTLQLADNTSNVFGPLTLDDATVIYNKGYGTDWGMMVFSGKVSFQGTQPYVFNPAGLNANLASGYNEEIEIEVYDITSSADADVSLNLPFINFNGGDGAPSCFRKSGAGTLSLGAFNLSTGALRVVEGTLRIDGSWSGVNSSVTAESGGSLGGTGSVNRVVFNGGGFECVAGQSGLMTANAVEIGETGTVHILNPGSLPADEINVALINASEFDGSLNLADWTLNVDGVTSSPHLRVRVIGDNLVAGWAPLGTIIMLQ